MEIKLCFLIPSLTGGGAERVVTTLLKHLNRDEFTLFLIVINSSDNVYENEVPDYVTIIDLKTQRVRYSFKEIYNVLHQIKPDIVFSTLGYMNIAIGLLKPFLPKNTVYLARESNTVSEILKNKKFGFLWGIAYQYIYKNFDSIICQSKDMYRDLYENFHIPKTNMVIINNPVDVDRVSKLSQDLDRNIFDNTKRNILAVGRLAYQKGFDLLLKALAIMNDDRLMLHILGEGEDEKNLRQLAEKINIEDRVRFLGFVENPYPFFAQADVFVLSSRFEGFPNVVLEALACGTPVISTPCPGGINEILNNAKGCAIASHIDEYALAETITNFDFSNSLDPKVVDPWRIDKIIDSYENLFHKKIAEIQ